MSDAMPGKQRLAPEIEATWNRSELLKADILAKAESMTEDGRSLPPKPGEWSPLQVIAHLLKAEQFVIGYGNPSGNTDSQKANPFVIAVLCSVLRAGIPLPAPNMMLPDAAPAKLDVLVADWTQEREQFFNRLQSSKPEDSFGLHPYFGIVTTQQVVDMLEAHLIYHWKRFPKPIR